MGIFWAGIPLVRNHRRHRWIGDSGTPWKEDCFAKGPKIMDPRPLFRTRSGSQQIYSDTRYRLVYIYRGAPHLPSPVFVDPVRQHRSQPRLELDCAPVFDHGGHSGLILPVSERRPRKAWMVWTPRSVGQAEGGSLFDMERLDTGRDIGCLNPIFLLLSGSDP